MVEKIRVMVVDDSAFMRKFISDMINAQQDMEVISTAKDGTEAIDKARTLNPDVITMDVEMPHKNGMEALREIMKSDECFQVIMLSGLTAQGSSITMEALSLGAFDFVQKPSGFTYFKIGNIKHELVEKIRYAKARRKKLQDERNGWDHFKKIIRQRAGIYEDKTESGSINVRRDSGENKGTTGTLKPLKKIEAAVLGASTGGRRYCTM